MRRAFGFLLIFIALLSKNENILGQQMPLHSQFLMNEYLINPAIAGYDGYSKVNLYAREQWAGLPQSPKTYTASFQTRILGYSYIIKKKSIRKKLNNLSKMSRIGLGGLVYDDKSGTIARTGFQFTYAYHIPFNVSQLSFGISAGAYQFKLDKSAITLYDQDDPYYLSYDHASFVPDANFGVYYLAETYNLGFSLYNLFQSAMKLDKNGKNDYQALRNYYISGGYKLDLKNQFLLYGYILLKATNKFNSMQADASVTGFYQYTYWVGLSYRTINTLIIRAGFKLDNFYFGYAFDYNFNSIRKHTYGSHEITAAVKFGQSARRYRWINHDLY